MTILSRGTYQLLICCLLSAALMTMTTTVNAQSTGQAAGTVVDESGGAIAGARVTVETPLGRQVGETTTSADGAFSITGLPAGSYFVIARADAFTPARVGLGVSDSGTPERLTLTLRVAGFAETVPVTVSVDRLDTAPDDSPAAVRVVARSQIEALPVRRLFDALALMPNVDVRQAGGPLGEGSITMYGISGQPLAPTSTVVALNGMPMNNGLVPEVSLNLLPLILVDRLEMVQGPGASAFGSNAMTGVLNVRTRRPTRPIEAGATVNWATRWGTGDGSAYAGGGRDNAYHWVAAVSSATTNGHLQPGGRQDYSDATKTNLALVADRVFDRTELTGALAYLDVDEHNPDVRTPRRAQRLTSTRLHINLGVTQTLSDQLRVAAAFVRNGFDGQSRETFDTAVYGFGQAAQRPSDPSDQTTTSNGVLTRVEWNRRAHALTAGGEFASGRTTDNVTTREFSGNTTGLFAHYRLVGIGDRLVATAGYRYDSYSTYTAASHSPKLGVVWRTTDRRWLARMNVSRAFSAPTFSQLFSTGFVRGNANLVAQTLWLREGGVEVRPTAALKVGASVFRITLDDPIFPRFNPALNATQFTNVSPGSTATGASVTVDYNVAHWLIGGSYTHLDPGAATFHTWAHTTKAQIGYGARRWSGAMTLRSQRDGYWADGAVRPADDYTVLGARATVTVAPRLTVVLTSENLSDEAYATTANIGTVAGVSNNTGIPRPGRFFTIGLQAGF